MRRSVKHLHRVFPALTVKQFVGQVHGQRSRQPRLLRDEIVAFAATIPPARDYRNP